MAAEQDADRQPRRHDLRRRPPRADGERFVLACHVRVVVRVAIVAPGEAVGPRFPRVIRLAARSAAVIDELGAGRVDAAPSVLAQAKAEVDVVIGDGEIEPRRSRPSRGRARGGRAGSRPSRRV